MPWQLQKQVFRILYSRSLAGTGRTHRTHHNLKNKKKRRSYIYYIMENEYFCRILTGRGGQQPQQRHAAARIENITFGT